MSDLREVPGFNRYLADSKGVLYTRKGRIIRGCKDKVGYLVTTLRDDQDRKRNFYIHRAVALAFLGIPEEGFDTVDHIDGNKSNNKIENLRWLSLSENVVLGMLRNGRRFSDNEIRDIREMAKDGFVYAMIAEKYNVSADRIITAVFNNYDKVGGKPERRGQKKGHR